MPHGDRAALLVTSGIPEVTDELPKPPVLFQPSRFPVQRAFCSSIGSSGCFTILFPATSAPLRLSILLPVSIQQRAERVEENAGLKEHQK